MKKVIVILLAAMVALSVPLAAVAADMTSCTVIVEDVFGAPGETVTVTVRMADNPGFTNLAIGLDYNQEHLTLKTIQPQVDIPFSTNPRWEENQGYFVCASSAPVKENCDLFTATFEIDKDFTGALEILPRIHYIRNNEAVFSIFESIHAAITGGQIFSVLAGDVSGDGVIEYDDVMFAYRAFVGEMELTAAQMAVVDSNENGLVDEAEYQAIYRIYIGG